MNNPTIVIYGAGKGTRLGFDLPKPLVKINGKRLIEYQIDEIIRVFPKSEIVIIGGYKFEELKNHIQNSYPYLSIHTVFNKDFEGSIIKTFDVSIEYMKKNDIPMDDVIRIDGDVFFFNHSMDVLQRMTKTTFFKTQCNKQTDTVVLNDVFGFLSDFEYVNSYVGNDEWACIERYKDNDYHKFWKSELKENMLKKGGHFYQYLEYVIESMLPLVKQITNTFEIDTKEDFENLQKIHEELTKKQKI